MNLLKNVSTTTNDIPCPKTLSSFTKDLTTTGSKPLSLRITCLYFSKSNRDTRYIMPF